MKDCELFSDYIITYKKKISKPQYANEIIVTDSLQISEFQANGSTPLSLLSP